ncbi:MAG: hypothetical protein K2X98_05455 [Alphaproteobacteria bacterium]|nr:hypothetical protein [Alphaproteobacteria bacterium]
MQISIKLLISATLLIAASTSGYTAQAQEATGETTRRTFKFTTYTEETRAKDWAQQIVDFCQHVIINDTVKTRLYDTSFTLFRDYPAQATKNQERV